MCPISDSTKLRDFSSWRLLALAEIATLSATAIAVLYPYGTSLLESTQGSIVATVLWIAAQSFFLILPGLLLGLWGLSLCRRASVVRVATICSSTWIFAVVLLVLCDNVAFGWISERFLSRSVTSVFFELPQRLAAHAAVSTWIFAIGLSVGFVIFVVTAWWVSGKAARMLVSYKTLRPWRVFLLFVLLAVSFSIPAMLHLRTTRAEMYAGSARHPFCSVYLFPSAAVGGYDEVTAPPLQGTVRTMETILKGLDKRQAATSVLNTTGDRPDVVIVVVESLRHELVDPAIMPSLAEYAYKGIHCRNHFSAGNATNHGIFSLLNGLNATWYSRPVRKAPILNRLFREAGYEVGFFAAHNDWVKFHMDGFLNRKQFDRFEVEKPNWLESDRRATQNAANFLDKPRDDRPPRLALLYLYSTHANYHSYVQDQVFQPAADDRFLIPFTKSDVPSVWNRYKNSARSVDGFLSSVMQEDRIIVVTGDHGESFLDDGVCGHGTRISRYQNMTPAVIYSPNCSAQTIDAPTIHADLLPTALSAAGVTASDPDVFDGWNLSDASTDALNKRVVLTRNYLTDDCGLVCRAGGSADVFAYRVAISLLEWKAIALNAIDQSGNEIAGNVDVGRQRLRKWVADRLGDEAVASF